MDWSFFFKSFQKSFDGKAERDMQYVEYKHFMIIFFKIGAMCVFVLVIAQWVQSAPYLYIAG